ncbi:hypothetical protein [Vibrio sp. Evd11]|uniref:DUF5983 family protein n=1 Tax=Vibrio sp. Evd11 TaxID=1207404 RepID=UPI0013C464CE|nr:hypothetical protein [Vibrio sp. Evd11]
MMIETIQVEIEKFCTKRDMELYVALALSTSHLTNEDQEKLSEFSENVNLSETNNPQVMKRKYGYFIKLLTVEPEELKAGGADIVNINKVPTMSDTFNLIMAFATVNRISLIEFDRDANTNKLFDTFE